MQIWQPNCLGEPALSVHEARPFESENRPFNRRNSPYIRFFLTRSEILSPVGTVRYNAHVIVLSIDTCDPRGSVAVLRERLQLGLTAHDTTEEYSSWLLPTVGDLLKRIGLRMTDLDAFAVASGPGSFTGVRVGLTTVKAWGEVYRKPIVPISRLRAMAVEAWGDPGYVAAWFDAHRGQVFGGVYKSNGPDLVSVGEEMVIAPRRFVETVTELIAGDIVTWASADPGSLFDEAEVKKRAAAGEEFEYVGGMLAGPVGVLATEELAAGRFTDALGLDANYVRRSDAEIFWKGAAHGH